MDKEIYKQIIKKKEFSRLPEKDVEKAFENFNKPEFLDEEKIKLTRDLLRKIYFAFGSLKILCPRIIEKKSPEEILKKHISTKERFENYEGVYRRILDKFIGKNFTVIDLGAGINGLSYDWLSKFGKINYLGVEAVGQLVDLMNLFFEKHEIMGRTVHLSLFELEKLKVLIKDSKGKKVVFLFKILDSLEMLERNYFKKLLVGVGPLVDQIVVSFATKSLIRRTTFKAKRKWVLDLIKENFDILDDFEMGGERYVSFCNRKR